MEDTTNFICAACRRPATDDNKVREDCGRLIHAKGCSSVQRPEAPHTSCSRCGINVSLIDPAILRMMFGVGVDRVTRGHNGDFLCAYCLIHLFGTEKAKSLLCDVKPVDAATVPGYSVEVLKIISAPNKSFVRYDRGNYPYGLVWSTCGSK